MPNDQKLNLVDANVVDAKVAAADAKAAAAEAKVAAEAAAIVAAETLDDVRLLAARWSTRVDVYGNNGAGELLLDSLVPFVITSGAIGVWGTPMQLTAGGVLGEGDPDKGFRLVIVTITESSGGGGDLFEFQFMYGTGVVDDAAVLTSGTYQVLNTTLSLKGAHREVYAARVACNSKLWVKCKCSAATKTISMIPSFQVY